MITNEEARISALASHASYGGVTAFAELAERGYVRAVDSNNHELIIDDPTTGFHAEIYRKTGTDDYIVAFTGTQNGQDWAANTI